MNKESKPNHDSEVLDEYDFSQSIRGKYYQRYQGTNNQKSIGGGASDIIASGVSTILSFFPLTAPVGAMGSFGLFVWQREQLNKFISSSTK